MEHRAEIDVDVPVRTAYDQWTQFEDFPLFMDYVKAIDQIDDTHCRWEVSIWGVTRTWDAEITEQTPDQRIAWTSTDGTQNAGVITFHALDDTTTRVVLHLDVDPQGFLEKVADWGGFVSDRAEKDLAAFKEFIEDRNRPTGGWRGQVDRPANRFEVKERERLSQLSHDQLVDRASEAGIAGRSEMTVPQLIEALVAHRVTTRQSH